jgi:uncharacterized coiled-coil DUF342 family protein
MFGFFRAIGRYIAAFFYLLTGQIENAKKALNRNPNVIAATYDAIVEQKVANIKTMEKAVAGLIVQEEGKRTKVRQLSEDIAKLENLKIGAVTKSKKVLQKYNGNGDEAKNDPEYLKHQAAFRDFTSSLEEKKNHAADLEEDVKRLSADITSHKNQMQTMLRELDKIKSEKHDTIAEVISVSERKKIDDMLNGISVDKSSKELDDMRQMRQQVRAEGRVSREMGSISTAQEEADYLDYAHSNEADQEFEKLISEQ